MLQTFDRRNKAESMITHRCQPTSSLLMLILALSVTHVAGPAPVHADDVVRTVAGSTIADCQHDLKSKNRVVRVRAIRTLGAFDADAGQALRSALSHDDTAVAFLAATHLGRIGGDSLSAATDELKELASSKQLSMRMAAAYALCEAGQTERYLPILTKAVSYPERGTACYAADLIGRLGSDASAAIQTLEQSYSENKPGVKGGDYHVGGAAKNALRKVRGDSE